MKRVKTPADRLREARRHLVAAQRLAYDGMAAETDPQVVAWWTAQAALLVVTLEGLLRRASR